MILLLGISRFPSWRRLTQFRIRTVLVVTTVLSMLLGWWANSARRQRFAVEALVRDGAIVEYERKIPWTNWLDSRPEWPSAWLDIGVDYFAHVRTISSSRTATPFSTLDLTYLEKLSGVEELWLENVDVSPDSFVHMKRLTSLRTLVFGSPHRIGDSALPYLRELSSLEQLALYGTDITDFGLKHISHLTSLRELILHKSQITDSGLQQLQSLSNLKVLDLNGAHITDTGLAYLKELRSLERLSLCNTQVSDAGLEHLENLPSLKHVELRGTRVTERAAARLRDIRGKDSLVVSQKPF